MIPLVPTRQHDAVSLAGWNFSELLRGALQSWIAHHQRLADLGIACEP